MAIVNDLIQQRARRAVQVIAQQAPVRAAYLFGSQVEGTADEFSDIDIAAFVDGAGQWDLRRRVRASMPPCTPLCHRAATLESHMRRHQR